MPPAGFKQKDLDIKERSKDRNTDHRPETKNIDYRFHVEQIKTNDTTMTIKTTKNLENMQKDRTLELIKTTNMIILIDAKIDMQCTHIDCALKTMATTLILLTQYVNVNDIDRNQRILEYQNEGGYIKVETID